MEPIKNHREELNDTIVRLQTTTSSSVGLPVPLIMQGVLQVQERVVVQTHRPGLQGLARMDHPPEPMQANRRGSLAVAAETAMDPGKLKRARGAFIEGFSANSARETKTKKRIDVEKLARLMGA